MVCYVNPCNVISAAFRPCFIPPLRIRVCRTVTINRISFSWHDTRETINAKIKMQKLCRPSVTNWTLATMAGGIRFVAPNPPHLNQLPTFRVLPLTNNYSTSGNPFPSHQRRDTMLKPPPELEFPRSNSYPQPGRKYSGKRNEKDLEAPPRRFDSFSDNAFHRRDGWYSFQSQNLSNLHITQTFYKKIFNRAAKGKQSSAISALGLLAFLFFLNVIQV